MNNVLVTGGAGFIGSHVVHELTGRGENVHVIDNFMFGSPEHLSALDQSRIHELDLRDRDALLAVIGQIRPVRVYHLAAIHFIPYCNLHPTEAVMINLGGTQNLLDCLSDTPLERLFFASTAAVYGPKLSEHLESDPHDPMDIYGATKAVGEQLVQSFSVSRGVPVTIGRLFNAIGHRETNPHLIPEIAKQLATGTRELQLGNLDPRRDFIDARDMAKAILAATDYVSTGLDVFNIGACRQYSVIDVVRICERILGQSIKVTQDPARVRKVERPSLLAGIAKLSGATGWRPEIELDQTLRELLVPQT